MAILSASWALTLFLFEHPVYFSSYIWLKIVYLVVLLLLGSIFLFSYVFPKKAKIPFFPLLIYSLTTIPFAYTIIFTKLFVANVTLEAWGHMQILGPAYLIFGVWGLFFTGWAISNYFLNYKKGKGREKLQLRYLFLGMFLFTLSPVVLDVLFPIFLNNSQFIWFSPISTIFLVGFTAYAIVKHRLLDISFLAVRTVSYLLLLFSLTTILVGLVFASTLLFSIDIHIDDVRLFIFITLLLITLFNPLRKLFENATDKVFFKGTYDSSAILYKLTHIMSSTIDFDSLVNGVLETIQKEMRITTVSIIIGAKKGLVHAQKDHGSSFPYPSTKELDEIAGGDGIIITDELEENETKGFLQKYNIHLLAPLITKDKPPGYLLLGPKSSGDIYFDKDIKTIDILRHEFAIALQNSQSYEEIKNFNKTLEEEVNKATKELRVANERLRELGKLKDEFFSIAAHELRTPLTAIQGNSSLIQEYFGDKIKDNKDLQEIIDDMHESSKRLIQIVNDYLDASRLEQGRIKFKKEEFDIGEIINEVIHEVTELTTEKGLSLKFEAAKESLPKVFVDKDRVKQLIYNLMGNAIKYTKEGGIAIEVDVKDKSINIKIIDTGIGISEKEQHLLFQKFQQVGEDHLDRKSSRGTGIGLYISKLLAEGMGGKVYLEKSEVGKGSTFVFEIPRVEKES